MYTLGVIGQILIGLFFVFMGLYNLKNRDHLKVSLARHRIHLPEWALMGAVILEVVGGAMVVLNFAAVIGAVYLAIFTVIVSYALHPFWTNKEHDMWKHLVIVVNNVAILGGLFLILSIQG